MKRLLVSALTLVLVLAVAGFATETRVMTMGDVNTIVKDEANIWLFPSTILQHPDMAVAEFSSMYGEMSYYDMDYLGMHYNFGDNGIVLGAYLKKYDWYWMYQPNEVPTADHRIDLFFGTPMGDNGLGVNLSLYQESMAMDAEDDESAAGSMAFQLGLGLTMMENLDLALHFGMGSWHVDDAEGETVQESDGNMMFDLGVRYFMEMNDTYTSVPHFAFMYYKEGITGEEDVQEDMSSSSMGIDVGWGMNMIPDERILVVGDFGIQYWSDKYTVTVDDEDTDLTDSDFVLPYIKLGLEGHVTKWWDVRLGATKYWHMAKEALNEDDYGKYNYAETTTYLGSAIYLGNLTLDIQVNPDFVFYGPNFVSGYNQELANRVSLKYTWGE